jgi:ribosome-binding protein aMBF1 (putative translation factor)
MKLKELQRSTDVLAKELRDPEFRAEWERTALARAIASRVIAHRVENDLSQTALAERLGMKQPAVARLESGEHTPTLETLMRIVPVLDIELVIDLVPAKRKPKLVTKRAQTTGAVESVSSDEYGILVAAG